MPISISECKTCCMDNVEQFFKRVDVLVGGLDPDIKKLLIACNMKSYASVAYVHSEQWFMGWIEQCIQKFQPESEEAQYIESLMKQNGIDTTLKKFKIDPWCFPLKLPLEAMYNKVKALSPEDFIKLA